MNMSGLRMVGDNRLRFCAFNHLNPLLCTSVSCSCRVNNQLEIYLMWSRIKRGKSVRKMENNLGYFFVEMYVWRSSCQHYICDQSVKWMESLWPQSREAGARGCGHTRGAGSGIRQSLSCPQRATSTFCWVRETNPISEGKVWRKRQLLVRVSNKTDIKPRHCRWMLSLPSLLAVHDELLLPSFCNKQSWFHSDKI